MAEIFNKEALEALDSHSEAEEMARVASPRLRLVLGAMVAMIIVVIYWCIFGTINYKVPAQARRSRGRSGFFCSSDSQHSEPDIILR